MYERVSLTAILHFVMMNAKLMDASRLEFEFYNLILVRTLRQD